ncbi:MAG: hypothetical protein QXS20_08705 [Candidatus Thorarchaeota archaeon]
MFDSTRHLCILMIVVLVVIIPQEASAQTRGPPTETPMPPSPVSPPIGYARDDGMFLIRTNVMTVLAVPEVPQFHFWFTSDDGASANFSLLFRSIIEFEDLNGDGVYQSNETVHTAHLSAYEWALQTGLVVVNDVTVEVWLKYTKGGVGVHPSAEVDSPDVGSTPESVSWFRNTTIQIWAHVYSYDYYGNFSDGSELVSYSVRHGSELKMDIVVSNFPFSSPSSMAVIQMLLREDMATGPHADWRHRYVTRERNRNNTGVSWKDWNQSEGNETRFEPRNETHTQRIDIEDTGSSTVQGFVSWLDRALITLPGGLREVVEVGASYVPVGTGLAINICYPNFDGGTLVNDPSLGLYEDAAPSPVRPPVDTTVVLLVATVCIVVLGLGTKWHRSRRWGSDLTLSRHTIHVLDWC